MDIRIDGLPFCQVKTIAVRRIHILADSRYHIIDHADMLAPFPGNRASTARIVRFTQFHTDAGHVQGPVSNSFNPDGCGENVEPDAEPAAPIPGNRASRRNLDDGPFNIGLYSKWSWCWPVNRRIIYNRASVDLDGNPWDAEHPVIKWNPAKGDSGGWDGDVPDGGAPPMNQGGYYPFIMKAEGHSRFFGPGMAEGPLPEHYEPWETPVDNAMSKQTSNPAFKIWRPDEQGKRDKYPIVCSTYRVCEHWQGGQMTRNMLWVIRSVI